MIVFGYPYAWASVQHVCGIDRVQEGAVSQCFSVGAAVYDESVVAVVTGVSE